MKTYNNFLTEDAAKFFYRVEYRVDSKLYNDSLEVLKTTLWFAPESYINKNNKSYNDFMNCIEYIGNEDKKTVYLVKIFSDYNKEELKNYFDRNTLRGEEYTVL